MTNCLFIGVDVVLKGNHFCVMNFDQHIFFNQKFSNNPEGNNLIINKIKEIEDKFFFEKIIIVMEATGMYSFHPACYCSSNEYLNSFNTEVYLINPCDFKSYKKIFHDLDKEDVVDAYVLADFARVGRAKPLYPFRGSQYIALQRLTRQRYHLCNSLIREKTYVLNNLYFSFSGLVCANKDDKPFSDMFGATSSALLEQFVSPDQIAESSIEELIDFISEKRKNHTKNPDEKVSLLKKAIRSSYRLDQTAYEPINIAIASSLNTIRFYQNQLNILDKTILRTAIGLDSNTYNILLSIRGIGKVYAAGIMAEIGNIDRFQHNSKLAKYSGLYWKRNQSGEYDSTDKKSSKKSNKYLRYYLVEATNSCKMQGFPFIKEYYDKKYSEVTKHQHKRPLVLSARKLERLIFELLRKGQYYKPLDSGQNDNCN